MYVKIMIDSRASASIIHDPFIPTNKFNTRKTPANSWCTMEGSFLMSCKHEVKIKLPELYFTAHIFAPFHVTSPKRYNFWPRFTTGTWNKFRFPKQLHWLERNKDTQKSIKFKTRTNFEIQESKNIKSGPTRIKKILDAKYAKANLKEITTKLKY